MKKLLSIFVFASICFVGEATVESSTAKAEALKQKSVALREKGEVLSAKGEAMGAELVSQADMILDQADSFLTDVGKRTDKELSEFEEFADTLLQGANDQIAYAEKRFEELGQKVESKVSEVEQKVEQVVTDAEKALIAKSKELEQKGNELIKKGEALVAQGEAKAEEVIAQGEALVKQAEEMVVDLEKKTEEELKRLEAAADVLLLAVEQKVDSVLKGLEQKVEHVVTDAEKQLEQKARELEQKGNELIKKGEALVEKGIAKGEEMIAEGERMIKEAEFAIDAIEKKVDEEIKKFEQNVDSLLKAVDDELVLAAGLLGEAIAKFEKFVAEPFEKLYGLRKDAAFVSRLSKIKSGFISVMQDGAKQSMLNEMYGELVGPVAGRGEKSLSLYQYINLLFWRFTNKILHRKFEPDEGYFYDDSALPLYEGVELGTAILVRGLMDLKKAGVLYRQTSEGGSTYGEDVGETASGVKAARETMMKAWNAYKIGLSEETLDDFQAARDAYNDFTDKFSLDKDLFNKRVVTFKFERVVGHQKESVEDFFDREGWRLVNRIGAFQQVRPIMVALMQPFIVATGMSPIAMLDLFARRPDEALLRLMYVPVSYVPEFEKTLEGYVKAADDAVTGLVVGALEEAQRFEAAVEKATFGVVTKITSDMQKRLDLVEAGLRNRYTDSLNKLNDLERRVSAAVGAERAALEVELRGARDEYARLQEELRSATVDIGR